ncbi:hypothetical protein P1P68_04035 [Streptomyces scabiei]|nr:hypothetical protein [Streptomyces scabiei]MDW8803980.1 hypothetical protein [Streptomyces scabiei]
MSDAVRRRLAVSGSASHSAVAEGAGGRSPVVSPVAAAPVLFTGAPPPDG